MVKFLDVSGYEGIYKINDVGNIYSVRTKKILKPRKSSGYLIVCLSVNNKKNQQLVHRLVAQTFIDNPDNKKTVNHIDGNKMNNSVSNLEWSTQSENSKHAFKNGLNKGYDKTGHKNPNVRLTKEIIENVQLLISKGIKTKVIASLNNISRSTVQRIKYGKIDAGLYI
jgi:hypothetical protein